MSFRSGCIGRLFAHFVVTAAFCCGSFSAHALIGPQYQLLLGNPTGAIADPNNHQHYLVQRNAYALDYSDALRQPNWASWNYTTNDSGSSGRSSFATDTNLPPGFYQVKTTDYQGSGYDRGHLCPSGDRTVSVAINEETFLMSNMMPQSPDNNQGVWVNLETYSRAIAASNEVLVICGPEGFGGAVTDSTGQIPIASNVWKIIVAVPLGAGDTLSRITPATRVIAVSIPNVQGVRNDPWQNYLTSVNHLQTNTSFTFFTALNSNLATVLRAKVDGSPATGITNIVPTSGIANSTVVLRGTNFTGATTVWFNGVPASFTLDSPNQISATVPAGATTGPISVIAAGGLSTSATTFTVTTPVGDPPPLGISLASTSVILSWPTNAVGFQLQLSPNLSPPQWTNHAGPVTITGTNYTATLPTPDGRMFFRLQNP
jgi:DNA/RNA endonuclease G (NUC1)